MTCPALSWARVAVALVLLAGCAGSPAAPPPVTQTNPSPPTSAQSSATVAIEDAYAIARGVSPNVVYDVRFLLRETGGKSGATVDRVVVFEVNGGSDETGSSCWREVLRVPAGGQLDTFYTDAGSQSLSYCGPGAGRAGVVSVEVAFTDDSGTGGVVRAPLVVRQ